MRGLLLILARPLPDLDTSTRPLLFGRLGGEAPGENGEAPYPSQPKKKLKPPPKPSSVQVPFAAVLVEVPITTKLVGGFEP